MLAALRVLHVDTSHAPARSAAIEGKAPRTTYQLTRRLLIRSVALLPDRVERGSSRAIGHGRAPGRARTATGRLTSDDGLDGAA